MTAGRGATIGLLLPGSTLPATVASAQRRDAPPALQMRPATIDVHRVPTADASCRRLGDGQWVAANGAGTDVADLRETGRDEWSVSLRDDDRDVRVRFDLHRRMVSFAAGDAPMAERHPVPSSESDVAAPADAATASSEISFDLGTVRVTADLATRTAATPPEDRSALSPSPQDMTVMRSMPEVETTATPQPARPEEARRRRGRRWPCANSSSARWAGHGAARRTGVVRALLAFVLAGTSLPALQF